MSDIVERAYIAVSEDYCQGTEWCWSGVGEPLRRFADIVVLSETEALRAENARLREALKPFTELPCAHMARFSGAPDDYAASEMIPYGIIRAARAAMGESDAD